MPAQESALDGERVTSGAVGWFSCEEGDSARIAGMGLADAWDRRRRDRGDGVDTTGVTGRAVGSGCGV